MDLERIVGFEWDAGNARKNEKHGVAQNEAEQVFFDPRLLVVADSGHSAGEMRFHALGVTIGRTASTCARSRYGRTEAESGSISARDMHRKERQIYDRKD